MKKVLFTTPILMHPPKGGPYLRIENSIKALNNICELHIVSRVQCEFVGGIGSELFYKKNSHVFLYSPSVKKCSLCTRFLNKILKLFGRVVSPKTLIEKDAKFIVSYSKKNKINIVWFGYGNISFDLMKKVKELDSSLRLICDTDSVWSRYILRELPFESDKARQDMLKFNGALKEAEEKSWTNFCDITTAVSAVDSEYYKSVAVIKSNVHVFTNAIDLDDYSPEKITSSDLKKPCIFCAGTFGPNSPMDKAVRWFVKDVLSLIKIHIPDVHCYFIGLNADKVLADIKDESITVVGQVDSMLPYLGNCDVVIVPLWFESGTRFKIIEAGACKKPVVSTTLGAEGLDITHNKDIIIADDPQDFANGVIKILTDGAIASELGKNLFELIVEKYSIKTLIDQGSFVLKALK